MKKKATAFTVSDGELVLCFEPAEEGGYVITAPFEPELVTEAESLEEGFAMARDAIKALRASRKKLQKKLALAEGAS